MGEHEKHHETKRSPFYKDTRFWSVALTILFLAAALFASLHFRLATVNLRVTDEWAESTIKQNVISQISANIRQQYPTLPDAAVQTEAQKQWELFSEQNYAQLEQQKRILSSQFKNNLQFETGKTSKYSQTYIFEMDPYLWWHQAENYVSHGSVCDQGFPQNPDGSCTDLKRLAPQGTTERLSLHTYLEATLIKVVRVFNDNVDSQSVVFIVPALLGTLAVIPAFFIGRKFAGNIGGFIAAMMIATHPVLMNRTIAGFADTDGYNYLLPMLTVWFILEAFDAKRWWSRITLSVLAGITVGLFSFAWGGWWLLFFIILLCLVAYTVFRVAILLKHHERTKTFTELMPVGAIAVLFFLTALLSVTILTNFSTFLFAFTAPFAYTASLQAPTADFLTGWPNILTTVAELNIPSLSTIVNNLGGRILVAFAAFGLFATLLDPRKISWTTAGVAAAAFLYYFILIKNGLSLPAIQFLILLALPLAAAIVYIFIKNIDVDLKLSIFMIGWLLATLFATTLGIRFLLLGIAPFAIGFGIAVGWLYIAITRVIQKEFNNQLLVQGIVGVVILLIVFNPVAAYNPLKIGNQASKGQGPGMNDAWWEAMRVIREQTPANTIITSWWDFGHWFRNIGNRSVTFDGGSQHPAQGHWVGKILLTPDESQALGILRMLDCGANQAFLAAQKHLDVVPAKKLVDELIVMTRPEAQQALSKTGISAEDQKRILELTHCQPPPAVFITSGDMIGKAGVWGHFGSWSFQRAIAYEYAKRYSQQEAIKKIQDMGYKEAEAAEMYYTIRSLRSDAEANTWISGWPGYITQDWRGCSTQNKTITCSLFLGITQTSQGILAIETITFNESKPNDALLSIGVYNNGVKLGGDITKAAKVVYADTSTKRLQTFVSNETTVFTAGFLIRKESGDNSTSYSVLLADPSQVDSMFTQLYFLDGVFNEHFTKLVETRESASSKIVVWNVTWPKD